MRNKKELLWVNKNAESSSLSHSSDFERLQVFSRAQRNTRQVNKHRRYLTNRSATTDGGTSLTTQEQDNEKTDERVPPQIHRRLSTNPDWTTVERRGITFFRETTLSQIIAPVNDTDFWSGTVPYLTTAHPAIKHIVVAIASTHELLLNKHIVDLNVLALRQCNKAIRIFCTPPASDTVCILASCILLTAYHILRCDLKGAHTCIENGLRIVQSTPTSVATEGLRRLLTQIGQQHGFKFWAPQITFQFERSCIDAQGIVVHPMDSNGPFTRISEMSQALTYIIVELIAKPMRNLARGAYLDPNSLLALEIAKELDTFSTQFEQFCHSVSPYDAETALDVYQLQIAYYSAYVIFHTKLASPIERYLDSFPEICEKMLELSETAIKLQRALGGSKSLDRFVNGNIYTLGMCSILPSLRERARHWLQTLARHDKSLVNWLRGELIMLCGKMDMEIYGGIELNHLRRRKRPTFVDMSCIGEDRRICLDYTVGWPRSNVSDSLKHHRILKDWDTSFGHDLTAEEIDASLKGILVGYRLYGKQPPSSTPSGAVNNMYFRGHLVPIYWEDWETVSSDQPPHKNT